MFSKVNDIRVSSSSYNSLFLLTTLSSFSSLWWGILRSSIQGLGWRCYRPYVSPSHSSMSLTLLCIFKIPFLLSPHTITLNSLPQVLQRINLMLSLSYFPISLWVFSKRIFESGFGPLDDEVGSGFPEPCGWTKWRSESEK